MRTLSLVAVLGMLLATSSAWAQSQPDWALGYTPGAGATSVRPIPANGGTWADWFGVKADVLNGTLTNPTVAGGIYTSPTLVSPALNVDGTSRAATAWLNTTALADKTVFLGGTLGFCQLATPSISAPIVAAGIGLYQHAVGVANCTSGQNAAIRAAFVPLGTAANGGGQGMAEVGNLTSPASGNGINAPSAFGTNNQYPVEVSFNFVGPDNTRTSGVGSGTYTAASGDAKPGTVYQGYFTTADLAIAQTTVQVLIANGTENPSINVTPNSNTIDFDDAFATGAYWANQRAAFLYAGAVTFDTPPGAVFHFFPTSYPSMIVQMLQWCRANNLRTTVIISPFRLYDPGPHDGNGYEDTFLESTQRYVAYLASNGALPDQWVVENYGAGTGANANPPSDGTSEDLTHVALWLQRNVVLPAAATGVSQAPGGVAPQGLQQTPTTAPVITANLSAAHVGPLHLADILGLGSMAAQNSDNVQITGGLATLGALTVSNTSQVTERYNNLVNGLPACGASLTWNYLAADETILSLGGCSGTAGPFQIRTLSPTGFVSAPIFSVNSIGNASASGSLSGASAHFVPVTFAALPTVCAAGDEFYVADGRNTGEAAGAGTGVHAYCNNAHAWFANGAPVAN